MTHNDGRRAGFRRRAAAVSAAVLAVSAVILLPSAQAGAAPVPAADHVYALKSVASGNNAEVQDSSTANAAAVVQGAATGGPHQLWQAVGLGNGSLSFVSLNSGKCLDVYGNLPDPGTRLIQWPCSGAANQAWTLTAAGTADAYQVRSVRSGLCLDGAAGGQLVQQPCTGGTGQQWLLPERLRSVAWGPSVVAGGRTFTDQTVRMVTHTSVAGAGLRIRLSNLRSTTALTVGAVDVAARSTGGAAVPGSHHPVTFGRSTGTTLAAGAELTSDVVGMRITAGQSLLVSIHLVGTTGASTYHANAHETTYISTAGDFTADDAATNYTTTTKNWFYLSGLDVVSPTANGTVVAFGDSITDGSSATDGTNRRWPDFLARRLAAEPGGQRLGVANAGIGGNRVLTDAAAAQGISATKRFAHDALGQPGVKNVILFEGINDLGANRGPTGAPLTTQDFRTGYQTLINQARAAGVKIIGATIAPRNALAPNLNTIRLETNDWIRTSGAFDAVVDLDRALRDPAATNRLLPAYDSGDGLHPNDAGMEAIANAVDLRLLRS